MIITSWPSYAENSIKPVLVHLHNPYGMQPHRRSHEWGTQTGNLQDCLRVQPPHPGGRPLLFPSVYGRRGKHLSLFRKYIALFRFHNHSSFECFKTRSAVKCNMHTHFTHNSLKTCSLLKHTLHTHFAHNRSFHQATWGWTQRVESWGLTPSRKSSRRDWG